MTIFTIDVSNHDYDRGPINWQAVRGAGISVAIAKATEGDPGGFHYTDPWFVRAVTDARANGLLMGGYHCLAHGDQTSINRQVDWLVQRADEVGGVTKGWWMLDIEPFGELVSRGMAPRLEDVLAFESQWHQVTGGWPIAHYLPQWVWGNWGSPSLSGLSGPLVSSNYPVVASQPFATLYNHEGGDTGKGWASYGGKTPTLWQFGSTNVVPGVAGGCDANASRLTTLSQLVGVLTTSGAVPTTTPQPIGDPVMSALPTLSQGASGQAVKNLQGLLIANGYGVGSSTGKPDGGFGPVTTTSVRAVQSAYHIGVDGIVGQHTWAVLLLGHDL